MIYIILATTDSTTPFTASFERPEEFEILSINKTIGLTIILSDSR